MKLREYECGKVLKFHCRYKGLSMLCMDVMVDVLVL